MGILEWWNSGRLGFLDRIVFFLNIKIDPFRLLTQDSSIPVFQHSSKLQSAIYRLRISVSIQVIWLDQTYRTIYNSLSQKEKRG
jgi:hypothetical protein